MIFFKSTMPENPSLNLKKRNVSRGWYFGVDGTGNVGTSIRLWFYSHHSPSVEAVLACPHDAVETAFWAPLVA